jgi:hypothetical protein
VITPPNWTIEPFRDGKSTEVSASTLGALILVSGVLLTTSLRIVIRGSSLSSAELLILVYSILK